MTLGSLTSLRANDVARHGSPRARTGAHEPGRAILDVVHSCHAPLSAADELTDNLSSERSMRQRISMGNRPHASSEPAALLETGIEEETDPSHDQQCRRITPDRADLGHVLEVH